MREFISGQTLSTTLRYVDCPSIHSLIVQSPRQTIPPLNEGTSNDMVILCEGEMLNNTPLFGEYPN